MGAIVQTNTPTTSNKIEPTSKKQMLVYKDYQVLKMGQGGHAMVRYEDNREALFVNKRIPEPVYHSQKQSLLRWLKTNSKNSCNVIKYDIKDESFFCSSHVNFKAIMEYSDCNLHTLLQSTQNDFYLDQCQISKKQTSWSNPLEILNLIKFCMETAEEHHGSINKWPIFHTTNILYFKQQKLLKFLYIPNLDQSHQNQIFFDPQSEQFPNKQSQQSTVFSIGMIVMSFLIKEDCSQCYDYQRFHFCQSVFEEKLQKLLSLSSKNTILSQMSYSQLGATLEQQLIEFAFCATSPHAKRPNFAQLKRKYFKLLRQLSLGCQSVSCVSTIRGQQKERSLLKSKRKRQEVNSFQNKEPLNIKRICSDTQDTLETGLDHKKQKEKGRAIKKNPPKRRGQDQNKQNVGLQHYR